MILSATSGSELRNWREQHGWPRRWLAQKMGVSQSALWKWEHADFIPIIVELACEAIDAGMSARTTQDA